MFCTRLLDLDFFLFCLVDSVDPVTSDRGAISENENAFAIHDTIILEFTSVLHSVIGFREDDSRVFHDSVINDINTRFCSIIVDVHT